MTTLAPRSGLKDAALTGTRALPSAASSTVNGAAVDTGPITNRVGATLAPGLGFFRLTYPAVTTTMAPDSTTFSYSIIESDAADLSGAVVKYPNVVVQTGTGGAGASGGSFEFRPGNSPSRGLNVTPANLSTGTTESATQETHRYFGIRIVSSSGTGNASSVAAELAMMGF